MTEQEAFDYVQKVQAGFANALNMALDRIEALEKIHKSQLINQTKEGLD